jgi:hypothetical protein
MKIVRLSSENFKRIKAVEITPDGAVVRISGRNEQGKTSLMDSIALTLCGTDAVDCPVPVRKGAAKAKTVVDLGDLVATRTWTAEGGTRLVVTNADGVAFASPQAVLDRLAGKLTLDPLAFSRMKPDKQLETLKGIVGIDFSVMDRERAELFATRTEINRQQKTAQAAADMAARHADAPPHEVSVSDLADEMQRRRAENDKKIVLQGEARSCEEKSAMYDREMQAASKLKKSLSDQIGPHLNQLDVDLERQIAALREDNERRKNVARTTCEKSVRFHQECWTKAQEGKQATEKRMLAIRKADAAIPAQNIQEIAEQMKSAETLNRQVRENQQAESMAEKARDLATQSKNLTDQILAIDAEKADEMASAKFPVPDLSFDETGVTFKGLPFSQASGAQKLRASVAIGVALNPKLRVLLVRDGSFLDKDGLKLLAELAEEHDAQVWLEVVNSGQVGIVIEDGMVVAQEESPA